MLDYKLLEALDMVVRESSFERAAKRLFLTQSAVSQRIKSLEEKLGKVLVVRESPVHATRAGEKLIVHFRQVRQLEAALAEQIDFKEQDWQSVRLGVNADSLAIGLLDALAPLLESERLLLECVIDDEGYTLDLLRAGDVAGCISTQPSAVTGCAVQSLGSMPYVFVATPAFAERHFAQGFTQTALMHAPTAIFGNRDSLHKRWLGERYGIMDDHFPCHQIPESHALFDAVCFGLAYAAIPYAQAKPAIASGKIIELASSERIHIPLYWHHWQKQTQEAKRISDAVLAFGRRALPSQEASLYLNAL
ncbi:LysR family transcriptional regulator ArgP [Iodobacter sp. LRB]|uniref:LysR family transcriptional regulator ArgP n=1 Tax=Iodobacter violaceini TaxID=3044271 RepID=A0ABX0KSA1_9NEIS|nr:MULTISPECIES: LysR family transcriptional regulator ArgP [Iodobacter]NHQ85200.1 LysR family transcriptional regulator ArgP [Iodobacter violacea]PHU99553.1 hypothetical protein CSQ88_21905 [Iodobacter sp. BJB302]